ncbi:MAG: phage protease [Sphingomonadaceae bacterium]
MRPATPPFIAAAAVEVNSAGASAPGRQRIQLLPIGVIELRDGRGPFLLPRAAAAAVIEATRAHAGRTAIMVDYDHQHHFGVRDGVAAQAPAAGWIDPATLEADDQGIWATVEWTPAARARLEAREYRYISPLFAFDPKSKEVRSILAAGLTNVPAIEALAAAASAQHPETKLMELSKIAAALGLADSATEAEVLARLEELSGAAGTAAATSQAIAVAASRLGLKPDASVDELVAAAAQKADPAKFVPFSALEALQQTVSRLSAERAEGIVAAAMAAGKVAPALKDWAIAYATSDEAGFRDWVAKAPAILEPGRADVAAAKVAADGLTDDERKVAASLRLSPEAFLAAKTGQPSKKEA